MELGPPTLSESRNLTRCILMTPQSCAEQQGSITNHIMRKQGIKTEAEK